MAESWEIAGRARRNFADLIEGMSDEQLDGESLAGAWTPRHVLGHVVYLAEFKLPTFFVNMAKAGFNYDKMADRVAREIAKRPVDDLLRSLRANATKKAPMPGFTEMIPVGDIAIHTQDIRRPHGLEGTLDDEILTIALDFVTTHKIGLDLGEFPKRGDVKLAPTDLDWTFGEGPEVTGTGEAILMTLAGRPISDELSGEGASLLL